jgi:hypothetical protein
MTTPKRAKLESPPQLAARFQINAATVRRRLQHVTPDHTEKRQDGTVIRLYNPAKVKRHLAKKDRPTSEIEAALLHARTVRLRIQNDVRAGILVPCAEVAAELHARGGALPMIWNNELIAQAPAELCGGTLDAAAKYGERLYSRSQGFFEGLRTRFAGNRQAPKLDLAAIASESEPIPTASTPKDELAIERLRRLRHGNAALARSYTPRHRLLHVITELERAVSKDLQHLFTEELLAVVAMEIPAGRSHCRGLWDGAKAILRAGFERTFLV